MLLQFGPAGGEDRELVLGAGAQLGDVADLPAYAPDRTGLAVARPVLVGGALQVLVGVGGEGQPDGGVDAGAPVLGGGERTESVARGVEALGPAGRLVAQRVEGLLGRGRLFLGSVVLLGRYLGVVVEAVDLGLDLGRGGLGIGLGGALQNGRGGRADEGERRGGAGGGPGEQALSGLAVSGFSMGGHGVVRPSGRLPVGGCRRARRGPATGHHRGCLLYTSGRDAKPGTRERGVMTAIALMCCFVSAG